MYVTQLSELKHILTGLSEHSPAYHRLLFSKGSWIRWGYVFVLCHCLSVRWGGGAKSVRGKDEKKNPNILDPNMTQRKKKRRLDSCDQQLWSTETEGVFSLLMNLQSSFLIKQFIFLSVNVKRNCFKNDHYLPEPKAASSNSSSRATNLLAWKSGMRKWLLELQSWK